MCYATGGRITRILLVSITAILLLKAYLYKQSNFFSGYKKSKFEAAQWTKSKPRVFDSKDKLTTANILQCDNVLVNLTRGKWVKKTEFIKDRNSIEYRELVRAEERVHQHLAEYRIKSGIHSRLWRDDHKCGYSNIQKRPPGSNWTAETGSWCDVKSTRACCNDEMDGMCVETDNCTCDKCVDMRTLLHADVCEWVLSDSRCQSRNYTAAEACDVIESKNISVISFVGDSLLRYMYKTFLDVLSSDPFHSSVVQTASPELRELCVGNDQFYWRECRFAPTSFSKMYDNTTLCGGKKPNFDVHCHVYASKDEAADFQRVFKRLVGKPGAYLILGVGLHMFCDASLVIGEYLGPAVDYMEAQYIRTDTNIGQPHWPRIIFVPPDFPGLLKPPIHRRHQKKASILRYTQDMENYCEKHGIRVLNFQQLIENVHSYDGTHYALAVNLMKVRILLNYLESLEN